jgi:xanthine dehydrogenase accessory factor
MNFTLLDEIEKKRSAVLATILTTTGHTYKKRGDKALFELDNPFPVYGNFGSQCVDQDLVKWAAEAFASLKPRQVHVNTAEATDVDFGYGTYCGGELDILLEPLRDPHRAVYRELRARLGQDKTYYLVHDLSTGELTISNSATEERDYVLVEMITAPVDVVVFGATPLAQRLLTYLRDTDFLPHVIDWREAYLDQFTGKCRTTLYKDDFHLGEKSFVLILSHSFTRDKQMLSAALRRGCPYVGMLSSTKRRDRIFADLIEEGIPGEDIARVRSPIGIDIKARSDAEIAAGIVAELIGYKNL